MKLTKLAIIGVCLSKPILIKREEPFGLLGSLVSSLHLPELVETLGLPTLNQYIPLTALTDLLQVEKMNDGLNAIVNALRDNPGNDALGIGKIIKTLKGETEDETGLEADDIELVMKQSKVSRTEAIKALRKNNSDALDAVMELNS